MGVDLGARRREQVFVQGLDAGHQQVLTEKHAEEARHVEGDGVVAADLQHDVFGLGVVDFDVGVAVAIGGAQRGERRDGDGVCFKAELFARQQDGALGVFGSDALQTLGLALVALAVHDPAHDRLDEKSGGLFIAREQCNPWKGARALGPSVAQPREQSLWCGHVTVLGVDAHELADQRFAFMDRTDDHGVTPPRQLTTTFGAYDLINDVAADADHKRDQKDAGDGEQQRQQDQDRVAREVGHDVVGAFELAKRPPDALAKVVANCRVVSDVDAQLRQHHSRHQRQDDHRTGDEAEGLQLLATGDDRVEVAREALTKAQQHEQSRQSQQRQQLMIGDRLKRQERQKRQHIKQREHNADEGDRTATFDVATPQGKPHRELGTETEDEEQPPPAQRADGQQRNDHQCREHHPRAARVQQGAKLGEHGTVVGGRVGC